MDKNHKLTDKEIEKSLKNVKMSFAMENSYITPREEAIGRKLLKGEITREEALKMILSMPE